MKCFFTDFSLQSVDELNIMNGQMQLQAPQKPLKILI